MYGWPEKMGAIPTLYHTQYRELPPPPPPPTHTHTHSPRVYTTAQKGVKSLWAFMLEVRYEWRDCFALTCTYLSESVARLILETKYHSLTDLVDYKI